MALLQDLLLAVLRRPYRVPTIELHLAVYKASSLPAVQSLWPPKFLIFYLRYCDFQ